MTGDDIIKIAKTQIGYIEQGGADGKSGNITKFWDWWKAATKQNAQGQSWCACFVSWLFDQAKASSLVAAKNPSGFIYCPDGIAFFKKRNEIIKDSTTCQPGDIVFFDWTGAGIADHVGIVTENHKTYFMTIEGNTSPEGAIGSQQNGGGVYARKRYFGKTVHAIARPIYSTIPVTQQGES